VSSYFYLAEAALSRALEGIAQGASKDEVQEFLRTEFPSVEAVRVMDDALEEALIQCVEDIDPSWGVTT
jgi:hypothetical protein